MRRYAEHRVMQSPQRLREVSLLISKGLRRPHPEEHSA
jgi:hypothetical protein